MADRTTTGLRRWAHTLDDAFRVPGTNLRFGLDAIIGLIPGVGDASGAVLSAYTLLVAARVGAPPSVMLRVGANILIDALFGAVPVLGDLFDAGFKPNRRNVALLDRYLETPRDVHSQSRKLMVVLLVALAAVLIGGLVVSAILMRWIFART